MMSDFIDDAMVEAARQAALKGYTKAQCSILPIRAALDAALPMIGAKLAKEMGFLALGQAAARIRELTGAKP